ncbi:response regulator transcription factor [Thomasclavelia sp.]|uniref:response regulator transcription factor n=1 Tax=Thomasclavelia sp. TaxID=3025757 RepID=UPI0025DA1967|nr:response regulator transcription factor [Thomasclavelia sp.]
MAKRIFVVEDDENIREIINLALVSSGYEVTQFDNAIDAIAEINKNAPDLAIFDLMLPKMNGIDAIVKIRETNNEIPILILSAKDREIDKVNGLDSGSDDYMTKPFGILELQARVRSLLRRHKTSDVLKTKHIIVDKQTRSVKLDGQNIELTNKEYLLLVYLMDNKHRVVEREELLNEIWGYDFIGESRALDVHIRALRSKLNDDGHKYIKTVRSVGYRFFEGDDDSE